MRRLTVVAGGLLLGAVYALSNQTGRVSRAVHAAQTGGAMINSRPEGLGVVIDDRILGVTPLKLDLPLGGHRLSITAGSQVSSIPLMIEAGTLVFQYVDFASTTTLATASVGATMEPSRSSRGVAGAAADVPPALSRVTTQLIDVNSGETTVARTVSAVPGAVASTAAVCQTSAGAGCLSFSTPFEMQILEGGRPIGTSAMDRMMLPAGPHQLELRNAAIAFRTTEFVQVVAGKTVNQVVTVPNGLLSVNALPWADVAIDGHPAGTTPLANIILTIGAHEVLFTHPAQGERRRTVVITADSPTRIGLDFAQ